MAELSGDTPRAIELYKLSRKLSNHDVEIYMALRELAGVGVAFKLCQALSQKLNLDESRYLKLLDIVALGTISDIVPLVSENRVIAKLGLKLTEITKNTGCVRQSILWM